MDEHEFEFSVGDVLHVGDCTITVIDVDGPEVTLRIDRGDELETVVWGSAQETLVE